MLLLVPNLPLCDWSSQLFDLHAPSSTDVPALLLNQPNMSAVTVVKYLTTSSRFLSLQTFVRDVNLLTLKIPYC